MGKKFWEEHGNSWKINPSKMYKYLNKEKGFARYYPVDNTDEVSSILVQVENNIVKPVTTEHLSHECFNAIEKNINKKKKKESVTNSLLTGKNYFTNSNISILPVLEDNFNCDNKDTANFYFNNSFVSVTAEGISYNEYSKLDKFIWNSDISNNNFELYPWEAIENKSVFYKFLKDITIIENDEFYSKERLIHLCSLIGYMLHSYKDFSLAKAVILLDMDSTENENGRTGKGIIVQAISKLRPTVKEDGKTFRNERFAFQEVNADTKIVQIDDIPPKFDFRQLFFLVTEGMPVEKKNKQKFTLPFEKSPKMIITSNHPVQGTGSSNNGRKYEFELSNTFNDRYRPIDKYGQNFFQDWDQKQWNLFYSLMIFCCKDYLKNGVQLSKSVNIEYNKLVDATSVEFAEFSSTLDYDVKYEANDLYQKFKSESSIDYLSQRKFTSWIKTYTSIKDLYYIEMGHSGSKRYYKISQNPKC